MDHGQHWRTHLQLRLMDALPTSHRLQTVPWAAGPSSHQRETRRKKDMFFLLCCFRFFCFCFFFFLGGGGEEGAPLDSYRTLIGISGMHQTTAASSTHRAAAHAWPAHCAPGAGYACPACQAPGEHMRPGLANSWLNHSQAMFVCFGFLFVCFFWGGWNHQAVSRTHQKEEKHEPFPYRVLCQTLERGPFYES